jgi:hypothetical protein
MSEARAGRVKARTPNNNITAKIEWLTFFILSSFVKSLIGVLEYWSIVEDPPRRGCLLFPSLHYSTTPFLSPLFYQKETVL